MRRFRAVAVLVFVGLTLASGLALADPGLPLYRLPILGDQDGSEQPLVMNAPGFDLLTDVQTFRIPGEGAIDIRFDFVFREGIYPNEFGFFKVDNPAGKIGNLQPGDSGYLSAAFDRAVVIFPSGSTAATADVTWRLSGGDILVFFIVQADTLAHLRIANPNNQINELPLAFFSLDLLSPDQVDHFVGFRNFSADITQFGFEDLTYGGDRDYDDIVYNIAFVLQPSPTVQRRDVVFIRGIDSVGTCDGANQWARSYLETNRGIGFLHTVEVDKYLNFSYADGSNYNCPGNRTVYTAVDTCGGVEKAATELKQMIDTNSTNKVTIIAHSMGGLVSASMVTQYQDWARQRISSIITFDSPLKGITEVQAWAKQFASVCKLDSDPPSQSLRDLSETSSVIGSIAKAATIVPFYHFDATNLPDDLFIPRARVRLDSARSFYLHTWCGVNAREPNCTPPEPVKDNHSENWDRRYDAERRDKAFLVGCALAGAFDCTIIGPAGASAPTLSVQPTAHQRHFEMLPGIARVQFTSNFHQPVRMKLTAPDSTIYGPSGAGPVAAYAVDATSEVYEVANPAAGTWTIELQGPDSAANTTTIFVTVLDVTAPPEPLPPVANAGGPYIGRVGAGLVFDATGSFDPDGAIERYEWDFDSDGVFDSASSSPFATHAYAKVFVGSATLRVTDNQGKQATATTAISIRNWAYLPSVRR